MAFLPDEISVAVTRLPVPVKNDEYTLGKINWNFVMTSDGRMLITYCQYNADKAENQRTGMGESTPIHAVLQQLTQRHMQQCN